MKKLFVLLLMSLLVVNCGVDESSVGESKSTGSETKSTAEKVGKYAVYTVAGIGAVVCITAGIKKPCLETIQQTFIPTAKKLDVEKAIEAGSKKAVKIKATADEAGEAVAEGTEVTVRDYSKTFYGKLWKKIFGSGKSVEEAGETATDGAKAAQDSTD